MRRSGCSALHGVNPNLKKKKKYQGSENECAADWINLWFQMYQSSEYIRILDFSGSEYAFGSIRVLNITVFLICLWFWMCQSFEYTRVLNIPGFWIHQGSEYASGSEYSRVLNMPLVLIIPGFWICQSSEYASGSEYTWVLKIPLVLNIPGFWICLRFCI